MYCAFYGREISSGFLIVLRFDALYQAYVARYASSRDWYAIPRVDRFWHDARVRYRGLDRDALRANDVRPENLAEIFLAELERKAAAPLTSFFRSTTSLRRYHGWRKTLAGMRLSGHASWDDRIFRPSDMNG